MTLFLPDAIQYLSMRIYPDKDVRLIDEMLSRLLFVLEKSVRHPNLLFVIAECQDNETWYCVGGILHSFVG